MAILRMIGRSMASKNDPDPVLPNGFGTRRKNLEPALRAAIEREITKRGLLVVDDAFLRSMGFSDRATNCLNPQNSAELNPANKPVVLPVMDVLCSEAFRLPDLWFLSLSERLAAVVGLECSLGPTPASEERFSGSRSLRDTFPQIGASHYRKDIGILPVYVPGDSTCFPLW
jgi:hypothetical protein